MKTTFEFPDGITVQEMTKTLRDFVKVWNQAEKLTTGKKKSSIKWMVTGMSMTPPPKVAEAQSKTVPDDQYG